MRQNFGNYLSKLRRDKGLSQIDVAKKIGLTQAQICNVEKGVYFPSVDTLVKLSLLYDVTLDEMLDIKRERNVNVVIGDIDSERRFFTLMDKYHSRLIQKLEKDPTNEKLAEYLLSGKELFLYGKSICKKNLDTICVIELSIESNGETELTDEEVLENIHHAEKVYEEETGDDGTPSGNFELPEYKK